MFDTTAAYDRIVIDDPDEPQSVQLEEEEDVPLISVDGVTHKMPPDQRTTSCGREWHAGYSSFIKVTDWKQGGADVLCVECFTPFERKEAAADFLRRLQDATDELPMLMSKLTPLHPRKKK
jgi:hypothetical protein